MKAQAAKEVDDEAVAWALRINAGDLDAPPSPELQAWLDGDPRRGGAFLRAQAALSLLERGLKAGDPSPPVAIGAPPAKKG